MRLFEFAGDAADDVEVVLRNIKGLADTNRIPAHVPYTSDDPKAISLTNLLNPLGYGEIDQQTFDAIAKKMQQSNEEGYKQLVKDYDAEGITINTKTEQDKEPSMNSSDTRAGKSVDQMAHNVVSKDLT